MLRYVLALLVLVVIVSGSLVWGDYFSGYGISAGVGCLILFTLVFFTAEKQHKTPGVKNEQVRRQIKKEYKANEQNSADVKIQSVGSTQNEKQDDQRNTPSTQLLKVIQLKQTGSKESDELPKLPLIIENKAGGTAGDLRPNTREAVAFENDYFCGKALLKVRSEPLDPYYVSYFEGRRRTFEVMIQGRFKKPTRSTVFMGLEITKAPRMGFVSKSLARLILALINKLTSGLHYSFGDAENDIENGHIVFPITRAMDRLIVTPPGETPPELGVDMFPDVNWRSNASVTGFDGENFDTANTYSFSFHTMYIDLLKWKVVNFPGVRDMDLRSFWGEQPLRLVAYDRAIDLPNGEHSKDHNRYFFCFSLINTEYIPGALAYSNLRKNQVSEEEEEQGEENDLSVENASVQKESSEMTPRSSSSNITALDGEDSFSQNSWLDVVAWIELDNEPPCAFVIKWNTVINSENSHKSGSCLRTFESLRTFYLTLQQPNLFPYSKPLPTPTYSLESSLLESIRQFFSRYLKLVSSHIENQNLQRMLTQFIFEEASTVPFLTTSIATSSLRTGEKAFTCAVARAMSHHHWREEHVILTEDTLFFTNRTLKYNPSESVSELLFSNIISVNPLEEYSGHADFFQNTTPFPNYFFLQVNSLARIDYLCLSSLENRTRCLEAIKRHLSQQQESPIVDPQVLLPKEKAKRIILNNRGICFLSPDQLDPNQVVSQLLSHVLELIPDSPKDVVLEFVGATSALKNLNLSLLQNHDSTITFFLNLHNTLVQHALLVFGPPNSLKQRAKFFSTISYDCGGLLFSLSEIEHLILRYPLSSPRVLFVSFLLPKVSSAEPRCKFGKRLHPDWRINFALCSGTKSSSNRIPIFDQNKIDQQLHDFCSDVIPSLIDIEGAGNTNHSLTVKLPKICEWYKDDFGVSADDSLRLLIPYLPVQLQTMLNPAIESRKLKTKYQAYDWNFHTSFSSFPL